MTAILPVYQVLVDIYYLILASWNACLVLLQVIRSAVNEAQQEAARLMEMLDDGGPMMRTATSYDPTDPWQMLIVSRASSFVLLLRLSSSRVLHLEVDERFITAKFEVIKTDLLLNIRHISCWLQPPIGVHDTRLVKYTPMKVPYLWKEHCEGSRGGATDSPRTPSASSGGNAGSEGRAQRRKCIEVITESAMRRRIHLDRLERVKMEFDSGLQRISTAPIHAPLRATDLRRVLIKTLGESTVKRQALANAAHAEASPDGTTYPRGTHGELVDPQYGASCVASDGVREGSSTTPDDDSRSGVSWWIAQGEVTSSQARRIRSLCAGSFQFVQSACEPEYQGRGKG